MRVAVGMSGGVDSSVCAALLKEAGHEVFGITMLLCGNLDSPANRQMIKDAEAVAKHLGIEHRVLDFTQSFYENVIADFLSEYAMARTPNPCVRCNERMKFGALLRAANEMGAEKIATGHYARIEEENGRHLLKKSVFPEKDQSYFLYRLKEAELSRVLFPLEGFPKEEVRRMAENLGLSVSQKKDSQEICFVPDDDYVRFLHDNGICGEKGDFVLKDGTKIGTHRGLLAYTVGQRRGLGIAWEHPLYVQSLSKDKNQVVLGKNEDLYGTEFEAADLSFIPFDTLSGEKEVYARVRYRTHEKPAHIRMIDKERLLCKLEEPERAITPGQSVVFYDGDTVLGGGIIEKV